MKIRTGLLLLFTAVLLGACSPKIHGTITLVDAGMNPVTDESPEGTVINMINTTSNLENASYSTTADEKGKFESEKKAIIKGTYKVEARRLGYETATETVEIGGSTKKKIDFSIKKIAEGDRKSLEGASSDEDKIINPGEVNIQPPSM